MDLAALDAVGVEFLGELLRAVLGLGENDGQLGIFLLEQ